MAWVKIPPENHPLFRAAVPKDPRVSTVAMFGGLCMMVNGNMAAGLWAKSAFVTLDADGQREALALDGAEPFDPMGRGKPFGGRIVLPETILDEPDELRAWIKRAVDYTGTLPPKKKAGKKEAGSKKAAPAKKAAKPAAKKQPTAKKKPAARSKPAARGRGTQGRRARHGR